MKTELLLVLLAISIVGIVATRIYFKMKQRRMIGQRLERLADIASDEGPVNLLRIPTWSQTVSEELHSARKYLAVLDRILIQSGHEGQLLQVLLLSGALLIFPPLLAFAFGFDLLLPLIVSMVLSCLPIFVLKLIAGSRRMKFCQQMPDAIDLMVSVLRSGHSIPQSVKSVSEELAQPCGLEFGDILQRMNLGQPLAQAMSYSVDRFESYELDLIRRAVSIQAEVGGSLAELLDKTNGTLRQRLKLVRQVEVITAQSKLSAIVVGLLPFVLAAVINFLSPGYLQPLIEEGLGRNLLIAAIVLQVSGLLIMKRMSTMRV